MAMVAGIILPAAMFIYAWTSFPRIHWIAPIIGITVSLSFYCTWIQFSSDNCSDLHLGHLHDLHRRLLLLS